MSLSLQEGQMPLKAPPPRPLHCCRRQPKTPSVRTTTSITEESIQATKLKDWRRHRGDSRRDCKQPLGHGVAPKFLWGGTSHQGGRRASRKLDPDGCLVRFGSQPAE